MEFQEESSDRQSLNYYLLSQADNFWKQSKHFSHPGVQQELLQELEWRNEQKVQRMLLVFCPYPFGSHFCSLLCLTYLFIYFVSQLVCCLVSQLFGWRLKHRASQNDRINAPRNSPQTMTDRDLITKYPSPLPSSGDNSEECSTLSLRGSQGNPALVTHNGKWFNNILFINFPPISLTLSYSPTTVSGITPLNPCISGCFWYAKHKDSEENRTEQ